MLQIGILVHRKDVKYAAVSYVKDKKLIYARGFERSYAMCFPDLRRLLCYVT
jgi:hypothetical protein